MMEEKSHSQIYHKLNIFVKDKKIPHIIFHGSKLSYKDKLVIRFLKNIYVTENAMNENVMFVNCGANGKGIKFIREELKFFAKTNSKPGILFKSIVLMNAEHLTFDAQSALRRCIELYSRNARFFILIENKNNLLVPIISRFCEIYVPDIDPSKVDIVPNSQINNILDFYSRKTAKIQYKDLIETVDNLYENALCTQDVVDWIYTKEKWSNNEKANIGMIYKKIKSEYRCEKMLMIMILSLACFEPNIDLKKISFI